MSLSLKKRIVGITISCSGFIFTVGGIYPNGILWLIVTLIGIIIWVDGVINE